MISTWHHVRIDFEFPPPKRVGDYNECQQDIIVDAILATAGTASGDSSVFEGNPCCGPYLEARYQSLPAAEQAEDQLMALLRQHNCKITGEDE